MYKGFRCVLDNACYFGSGCVSGAIAGLVHIMMRNSKLRYITTPATFIFMTGLSHKMAGIASDEICGFADDLHDIWVRSKEEPEEE